MGRGVMPDDFTAYRKQRHRWAFGAMQIVKRHARALLNPFDRSLTQGQRYHFVMGWMPWFGDALGLAFVLGGLFWSLGLILLPISNPLAWPGLHAALAGLGIGAGAWTGLRTVLQALGMSNEFPILLFMLPSLGLFGFKLFQIWTLYAARVSCGAGDRLAAALGGLALTHTIGKAVWQGLFKRRAHFARTPKMDDAPALVQALATAREELVLLALLWAAAAGITVVHQAGTWEAVLWTVILLVQSVPYVAAVTMGLLAALPARQAVGLPAPVSATSGAGQAVARNGGD